MKALVFATGYRPELVPLIDRYPSVLLPVADRPFLQHVVESLVEQGVAEFHFVLSHLPEKVEALLGDGARWGARFVHHLARDPERPYRRLASMDLGPADGPILLVHGDRLLAVPIGEAPPDPPVAFCHGLDDVETGDASAWTGWAWVRPEWLRQAPTDADEAGFAESFMERLGEGGRVVESGAPLSVRSFSDILESQARLLSKDFPAAFPAGREVEEGVWLCRNVSLHPTARLEPPVYVGQNCRIGAGASLGPNAVIGHDSVLDARCVVRDATIFPGSYVGEALELEGSIVDRNVLINVEIGASVSIVDDFILGSIGDQAFSRAVQGAWSRVCGLLGLVVGSPVLLLTALWLLLFRKGPVLHGEEAVRLPAGQEPHTWRPFRLWSFASRLRNLSPPKSLVLRFLPGLLNVVAGSVRLVGLEPRSRQEIESLPPGWQVLYLRSKAGLVTEAYVEHGAALSDDAQYSAEAFYSVSASFGHDLRLLLKYFWSVLSHTRWQATEAESANEADDALLRQMLKVAEDEEEEDEKPQA